MFSRSVLLAVFRLMLVLAVAASGITFSADDAEARRGGRVRSSGEHSSGGSHSSSKDHSTSEHGSTAKRKADEEHDEAEGADRSGGGTYIPGVRVRSREAARGAETANDGEDPASPRALPRHRVVTVKPQEDLDVPNCPTGKICTICLAGCERDVGSIVDAQVKTPIPRPER